MPVHVKCSNLLKAKELTLNDSAIKEAQLFYPTAALFKKKAQASIGVKGNSKYVALERQWWFWVAPKFGNGTYVSEEGGVQPHECHVLMMCDKLQKEHVLMLCLSVGDWRSYLHGNSQGLHLAVHGGVKGSEKPHDQAVMLMSKGSDPIELMRASVALLSRTLKTFKLREEKRLPAFIDLFGWCTWNAYYQEVSERKVINGLQAFKQSGIQPRFLILDDGWQDINKQGHMNSFKTNKRFPKGLAPLIEKAKYGFGVELFGVWHALQGYWGGVNPKGPLSKTYEVISKQGLKPCDMKQQEIGLVSQKDIHRFYQDFHAFLHQAGVDMVKIDSQSGMQELCADSVPYGSTMSAYQKAIQASTQTHFEGNLLHCMSNTQDVAYNMSASMAWRNSDDFYPDKKPSHANHLVINAYNAIWSHTFSCPDWDMFMSGHYTGSYHAAARAISGGPIYISDKPGDHDPKVIKRLCLSDGRVLRSKHPALPFSQRVYEDPKQGDSLLFVRNRNGRAVVLGAFHCQFEGAAISDHFTVRELGIARGEVALWYARAQRLETVRVQQQVALCLNELEAEIIHAMPIDDGVAALGLIDKDNASAAIISHNWDRDGSYRMRLIDGGQLGVYCQRKPQRALDEDGRSLPMKYDKNSQLLTVKLKTGSECSCHLYW